MDRWVASLILWLPLFLLFIPSAAHARIYKWVDAQGRIHYSDSPVGDAVRVDDTLPPASLFTRPPETIPSAAKPPEEVAPPAPAPSVAVPPPEGEFADDEPSADTEPTVQDNLPDITDTPGNIPEGEGIVSPSVTADTPNVVLPSDEAPENQFGPGNEFDSEAGAGEIRE